MVRCSEALWHSPEAMMPWAQRDHLLSTSPVFMASFRYDQNSSCLQANMPKRVLSCGFKASATPLAPAYHVYRIIVPSQQDWLHPGECVMPERCVLHTLPHVSAVLREQLCFLPHRDMSLFAAFFEIFWMFVHFPCSCFSPTSRISSKKERWLFFFFLLYLSW